MSSRIRSLLRPLAGTPLHPQWLVKQESRPLIEFLATVPDGGIVLDIGCFDMKPKQHVPEGSRYVGLDYLLTAEEWYGTRPHVYGDAADLPVAEESVDVVLLLSVLEHLRDPERVVSQVRRALRPNGHFVIQVPFLYPLHDEPRDFGRWTRYGLVRLAERHGFVVERCIAMGSPLETAALLGNIAWAKTALNWIERRSPLALLAAALPIVVLFRNVAAKLLSSLSPADDMMPMGYHLELRRE